MTSHPWLVYRFSPSCFICQVCGATSIYELAKSMAVFIADFRTWAEPHFGCPDRRGKA